MRRCWQRYAAFWAEREAPDALALLRITFSIALIASLLEQLLAGNVREFYALPEQGGIFDFHRPKSGLSLFRLPFLQPTPRVVFLLVGVQLLAAVLLLAGLWTRLAALVCFI